MDDKLLAALIGGGVSLVVAGLGWFFNPIAQRQVETLKAGQAEALAAIKAQLDEGAAERKAQRDYEYEARKRLYTQVEPLIVQIAVVAENAFDRVANLAKVTRAGYLDPGDRSWLHETTGGDGYYLRSTVYRLLAPLAYFQLLREKTTQVDFKLDPRLDAIFRLLRQNYRIWAEEFRMAEATPALAYEPYHADAAAREPVEPQRYRRQGVALGRVDNVAAEMVVPGEGNVLRARRLGEFDRDWIKKEPSFSATMGYFAELFDGFHPETMPVLWRLLCAQAALCYVARRLAGGDRQASDVAELVRSFCRDDRVHRRFAIQRGAVDSAAIAQSRDVFTAVEIVLVRALEQRDLLD